MTRLVAVGVALLAFASPARAEDGKLSLTVKETAGIKRFSYPVYVKLKLPREATEKDRFRLLADGKPVAAQFRLLKDEKKAVALDFTLSCGPLEKKTLTVEYGEKVEAGPEPKSGMKVAEEKGVYTVRSGGMNYAIDPARLWLRSVKDGKKEFLQAGGGDPGEKPITVVRQGPLAVCLRRDQTYGGFPLSTEFTFPRSKSWVEIVAGVDDETGFVDSIPVTLPLVLSGKRALVDFGAGSVVYTTLSKSQRAELIADDRGKQRWAVNTGDDKKTSPFVVPTADSKTLAEGWAHVMDDHRCTAVAVADFGRGVRDEISANGAGELVLRRTWPKGTKGRKALHFWLHFVDAPVQVGALTSPQSMMAPLEVEVK
jgi:hypothetical protein